MTSGSFASSYVETVRLLDPTCHNFRTLSVRNPRNSVAKYPLFLRNTLTPAPRNNVARYTGHTNGVALFSADSFDEAFLNLAELIIAKQRNGPTGDVPLVSLRELTRFESRAKNRAL
jgi:replicative DNA helicase